MLEILPPTLIRSREIIEGKYETEASGGINLDNILEYAETGVDYTSVGASFTRRRALI